ncbi:hypothetical protein ACQY1Q_02110 [Tenacibaculum sp. TC6]|uniref:hypothetical protein n=1 Tax=Tenacibaculum sp. TC6 TaxID=3423223 RepID=UPI003D35E71D
MVVEDLIGDYSIVGNNQDEEKSTYNGNLKLTLDRNHKIIAKWSIGDHEQMGSGTFDNDILVINFKYAGVDRYVYKGIVVYWCISKDMLDGFWSEKHGNPLILGKERCFRIQPPQELLN